MKRQGRIGRGEWIRTTGLLVPNQALYQAEPRPAHVHRLGSRCSSQFNRLRGFAQARTIEFVTPSRDFRDLPAVHEVLERMSRECSRFPRALVAAEIRRALEQARTEIRAGQAAADAGFPSIETRAAQ